MVKYTSGLLLLGAGAALVSAAPAPLPTAPAKLGDAKALKRDTACTFTDASAVSASKTDCATIVLDGITVPSGTTLDLTDLNDDTSVIFSGTTSFGYEEWKGPLISVSGTGIKVSGTSDHVIDGNGAEWWDGEGGNGGKTKPKFFYAHKMLQSSITGLNIKNTPVQGFSINGAEDLVISDVTIDNSDGDTDDLGHNTDAFDVGSSSYVTISGATVYNQDDCLAINSGTYITFTGGYCSGGHGLSIGSVGGRDDNTVENIYIADSTITNSDNGVRIKTVYDATGTVSNVTYTGITLSSINKYGIVIEQDYENGSPTGDPTNGVTISDLTLSDITGSVGDDATEIYILCGDGSCTDWTMSDISITGGSVSTECENVPSGSSCDPSDISSDGTSSNSTESSASSASSAASASSAVATSSAAATSAYSAASSAAYSSASSAYSAATSAYSADSSESTDSAVFSSYSAATTATFAASSVAAPASYTTATATASAAEFFTAASSVAAPTSTSSSDSDSGDDDDGECDITYVYV